MSIDWQGVFPALMTEFKDDGALDLEARARHKQHLLLRKIRVFGYLDGQDAVDHEQSSSSAGAEEAWVGQHLR